MNPATDVALVTIGVLLLARTLRPSAARTQVQPSERSRRVGKPSASDWATFLDTTSTEVRSGSSLIAALAHARRRHPALAARTFSFDGAIDPDLAVVAQSIHAALQLGGPVAATLHHGAALLRERAAQRAEVVAHSAQARLSAQVLTAVPLLFTAWSMSTSASFRHAIATPVGRAAAIGGLLCNAAGWCWMRHIIDKATP